jgi:hypothetical protein
MKVSRSAASRRTPTRAAALALFLAGASTTQAYVGTFDPEPREYTGPQLVTFIDSNAAPVRCIQLAVQSGDISSAVLGMVAPMAACTREAATDCTIIAPISRGVGQIVAAVGAMAGPDAVLGHEFRHCRDTHFHPAGLPFGETSHKAASSK